MRRDPDAAVVSWLDGQPTESMWTTSITVFEVTTGLRLLPAGRRRRALEHAFDGLLAEELDGRVQAFDTVAARAAGEIAAQRQAAGRPLEVRDVQIAGIALARRAQLATRNTRHFTDLVDRTHRPLVTMTDSEIGAPGFEPGTSCSQSMTALGSHEPPLQGISYTGGRRSVARMRGVSGGFRRLWAQAVVSWPRSDGTRREG